eukprot:gene4945-5591_t
MFVFNKLRLKCGYGEKYLNKPKADADCVILEDTPFEEPLPDVENISVSKTSTAEIIAVISASHFGACSSCSKKVTIDDNVAFCNNCHMTVRATRCKQQGAKMVWNQENDVAMCREILVQEPYRFKTGSRERGKVWDSIAKALISRAKESLIQIGDTVTGKQPKQNSLTPRYNPRQLKVIEKRGNRVTAQRENFKITRNISYFKKVPAEDIQEESDDEYDNRENHPEEEQDVQYRRSGRQRGNINRYGNPIPSELID